MHQLKEADMLTAKVDLLIKRLEDQMGEKKEVMHIHDSCMTCKECGDTEHLGSNCPKLQEDVNYINNNNYRPQQNQGWNQQQRPNYQGNYRGNFQSNNYNTSNQPPLRDVIAGQSRLLDQMSRKVTSIDKTLETISTRMDAFASAIKNQHSFNKMIESQLAQLAAVVPLLEKGKILGQPEGLETTNLVDIYNTANYYIEPPEVKWIDYTLPNKKDDLGRPVILISIGCHIFPKAICDFGASVNILPKVIYDKILGDPLLYTNMCLQLADQTLCYLEGVLEDAIIRVGQSYVPYVA
jgi:hypothetical protein